MTKRIGQNTPAPTVATATASDAAAVSHDDGDLTWEIRATIGGQSVVVGESSKAQFNDPCVLVSADGSKVFFTTSSDGYGFENEGEGIQAYDVSTGQTKTLMKEYFMIDGLSEVRHGAKSYILASMSDGGEGASHIAIVDASRGEIYSHDHAVFLDTTATGIKIGLYDGVATDDEGQPLPPKKTIVIKFADLDKKHVLKNEPDWC